MKKHLLLVFFATLLLSCEQAKKEKSENNSSIIENHKTDLNENEIKEEENENLIVKSNVIESELKGEELFKSILDTITIKELTIDLLTSSKWIYVPFDNCLSTYTFLTDGKGVSYNCEQELDFEIKFNIKNNFVLIEEFDIPHVDNQENKKIKVRDDKFIFDGKSLVLVGSTIYNIGGKSWTPEIDIVVKYDKN